MGMSPEEQQMMMAQQQGDPGMQQQMDPAMMGQEQPVDPAMMSGQEPGFADQYAQQFQDMPPELLQQLAMQGGDPTMMQQPEQPEEMPDPVTTAMMLTFQVYEQTLQNEDLALDVRAKAAHTYAQSLKVLSDIQNVGADQQQQIDPELQFQMEMQRMEMQTQSEQQKLQMEAQMMQLEMQFKVQEAELKLQIMREQAQIKADQDRAKAAMELDRKEDEHILNMAQKEDEADAQSARDVAGEDV